MTVNILLPSIILDELSDVINLLKSSKDIILFGV